MLAATRPWNACTKRLYSELRQVAPYMLKAVQGKAKEAFVLQRLQQAKRNRYGEDSWFVSSTPTAEVLGVADGVGGWRRLGIDAGAFASELMDCCAKQTQRGDFDGRNVQQLLIDGYGQVRSHAKGVHGSSTACLLAMNRSNCMLHSANLGDSGFLVVRNDKVIYKSEEQLHDFNTPYQLTAAPAEQEANVYCDRPESAVISKLSLHPGDLVILATDGLFDNVPESILLQLLRRLPSNRDEQQLQQIANRVVEVAKDFSTCSYFQSPFAIKAKASNVRYEGGGKPDDITVILASVAL
ncbi:fig [Drosophila busckii]|uniref:Protein phosphatase n=1 Tax=Drosophila busckii TaxID=30019 RepID=A0A0M3QYR0_DROBS|nr:protein phosphatase PTC7 homolog fig [Drosophila busckii]ALC48049.1 fig [Drosophila busckii]